MQVLQVRLGTRSPSGPRTPWKIPQIRWVNPHPPCPRGPAGPFATQAAPEAHGIDIAEMMDVSTWTSTAAPLGLAPPAPNRTTPPSNDRARLAMVAALGEGIRLAAAAGDIDAVRVAQEAIARLLGRPR